MEVTRRVEKEPLLSSGSTEEENVKRDDDLWIHSDRNEKEDKFERQKISGKAWGVLQFRKIRAFPFSVFFIVGNEFCERFSYYGMRAVLVLFLRDQLLFSENSSTAIYHAFIMLCYLLPLLGAAISDSFLGKYWTILTLSVVYCIGNILMSISAIPFGDVRGLNIVLAALGMIIIALGTGGIKPCVSAFGGDQFKEGQTDMLRRFFSLFYFSINAGSVISTLLTPVLRNYINCFDTCQCFALAFGVPAVLMIVSLVIFIAGTKFYINKKPAKKSAGLYLNVPLSIGTAIYRRIMMGKLPEKKNLLQYACPKFSEQFMEDVRMLLRVLVMLLPLPVFWALFDQQGSRWTLQATRMNGRIGKFDIQPDQVQALNPILILVFIPIFESIVYPLFGKCHLLKKPLQRMVVGMLIAGLAFAVAGIVEIEVQNAEETLKKDQSKLVVHNAAPDTLSFNVLGKDINEFNLTYGNSMVFKTSPSENLTLVVTSDTEDIAFPFRLDDQSITQVIVTTFSNGTLAFISDEYEEEAPEGGDAAIQVINALDETEPGFSISMESEGGGDTLSECSSVPFNAPNLDFMSVSNLTNVTVGRYRYHINVTEGDDMPDSGSGDGNFTIETGTLKQSFRGGAIYTIVVTLARNETNPQLRAENERYNLTVIEVDPPNSVSIFLQVPMYVLITAGEVMFSITGLEFAYSQAPVSMKAMCQAAWLLTVAFGNLVVIIVAESSIFANRALEFFFFAILIGVVTALFAVMSFFYKYVDLSQEGSKSTSGASTPPSIKQDESSALVMDKSNDEKPVRANYTSETEAGPSGTTEFPKDSPSESEF